LILGDLISESTDNALAKSVSLAYPFADIGIVFAALVLIGRSGRVTSGLAVACLAGGFVAMACSDSLYTYLTSVNNYATGSYIDFGWIVAYTLIAIAALSVLTSGVSFERGAEGLEERPAIWPSLVAYAPLVPLAGVYIMALTSGEEHTLPIESGILAAFALVIARQILTIYENVHLNRGLAQRADELSQKLMLQKLESMLQRNPALQHLGEAAAAERITQAGEAHMGGGQHHAPGSARLP
jgi:diguanylate cyclase